MSELIPYDVPAFEPDDPPLIPEFAPVPRKTKRVHGWTPERQRGFIEALADSGSVTAAAARVNMTPEAAYYLRRAEGAESFRAAWEAAVEIGVGSLTDIAIDRARHGVAVPVFHNGEVCGEKRWYNDRLLMFILKHHLPDRYGKPGGLLPGGRAPHLTGTHEERLEQTSKKLIDRIKILTRGGRREAYERLNADPVKRDAWELLNEKPLEALLEEECFEVPGPLPLEDRRPPDGEAH